MENGLCYPSSEKWVTLPLCQQKLGSLQRQQNSNLTSCVGAATICPRPSPPSVGAEAPRAAETTAVGSHGKYVPTLIAAVV